MIKVHEGLEIGKGSPVFIIAEVGSNWKTFDDCLHSINMAKACGADAVKFQLLDYNSLYGVEGRDNHLAEISLLWEWIPKLKTHADAMNIEFMCSAFSPELYDVVNPHVSVHKIASAEMTHVRILEKVKSCGKPVLLSTGASGDFDIKKAIDVLGPTPTVLMYCIAAYPAKSVRLEHIDHLRNTFGKDVGFSDHTTDMFTAPAEAIFQHGACALEKHVNFIDGLKSLDSPHSLDTHEFKLMVTRCRNNLAIEARQSHEENDMVLRHNRRLIATHTIKEGEVLDENKNFGIYRSLKDETHAYTPFMIDEVNGRIAKRAIKAGDGIGPGDV